MSSPSAPPPMPPRVRLMRLANAFQLSRAVQVAARLDLGAHLQEGARSADDLASELGLDARTLSRLLSFLAQVGVVAESADGCFGPTPLSAELGIVDSIAQGDEAWKSWSLLESALATGESTFEEANGAPFYAYAAEHADKAERWNAWSSFAGMAFAPIIAGAIELEASLPEARIVDVGGGEGGVLASVLRRWPRARGVLFDLPEVIAGAGSLLAAAGVRDRVELVSGNGFEAVPEGGDLYLLSRILMNCKDADAVRLLRACRRAMVATHARLVVVDQEMPEPGDPARARLAAGDLHLLLLWGGGYRTRAEMDRLLAEAGLERVRSDSLPAPGGGPDGPDLFEARSLR